jgi:uncharacterized spore protein YtfJ
VAQSSVDTALAKLDAVKDSLTVKRVFGDAYQVDGVTVIPVATVRGGGGAGLGEGTSGTGDEPNGAAAGTPAGSGSGVGLGFGVDARPVGVYVVRDGEVSWQPSIDVMRVVLGGQMVAIFALWTLRRIFARWR